MKNVLVADLMTLEPFTISPDLNLLECSRSMIKNKIGILLVVQGERLLGVISRRDILWALVKKSPGELEKIRAIDISPRKIATIRPTASIEEAVIKMNKCGFQKLPVIQDNFLIGLITSKDILKFHPELYKDLDEFDSIREETEKLARLEKAKTRPVVDFGVCEECGAKDVLFRVNGMLICELCRDSI